MPNGAQLVAKMAEWIAPGGALFLQSHSGHRENELAAYGALVDKLLAQGWTFTFTPALDPSDPISVDTWALTRPLGKGSPDPASIAAFARHKAAVREESHFSGGFLTMEDVMRLMSQRRR